MKQTPQTDLSAEVRDRIDINLTVDRADFNLQASLSLPATGTTVIFGPSGGGKTTVLRAIAGLEPSVQGQVSVKGAVWQSSEVFLAPHKRRIGFVFQQSALLPHLSVQDNLRYGWKRVGGTQVQYDECVDQLDLSPLLGRRIHQLSGGERQRIALGRALLTQPEVLLLDEPLAALDATRRSEILGYLERIKQASSIPMIYVTHAVDEMSRLADFLVLMKAGRVLHAGQAIDIMNRPDIPLALRDDAGIVVQTVVAEQEASGLLRLRSPMGDLYAQGSGQLPGQAVRVRLQARDVSIALSHHTDSSVLNILAVKVRSIREILTGQVLVEMIVAGNPGQILLAKISHASARRLKLEPGLQVWAQVKAVALLV